MLFNSRFLKELCSNDAKTWKLSIINRIIWDEGQQFLGLASDKSMNKKVWNRLISSVHIFYLKIFKNSSWFRIYLELFENLH